MFVIMDKKLKIMLVLVCVAFATYKTSAQAIETIYFVNGAAEDIIITGVFDKPIKVNPGKQATLRLPVKEKGRTIGGASGRILIDNAQGGQLGYIEYILLNEGNQSYIVIEKGGQHLKIYLQDPVSCYDAKDPYITRVHNFKDERGWDTTTWKTWRPGASNDHFWNGNPTKRIMIKIL